MVWKYGIYDQLKIVMLNLLVSNCINLGYFDAQLVNDLVHYKK